MPGRSRRGGSRVGVGPSSVAVDTRVRIGSIELLQVMIHLLGLRGGFFDQIAQIDFGALGYFIVGLFLFGWALSVALWKFGRLEQRYSPPMPPHSHPHTHDGDVNHAHGHWH